MAYRRCSPDGFWQARRPNEKSDVGWTNYSQCFPIGVRNLLDQVFKDESDGQTKLQIAQWTRYVEIFGFSVSLLAIIFSLIIFKRYRSLRNDRTRIHKSLFRAMTLQILIRLILYTDQALLRSSVNNNTVRGIDNMPYLCESAYVLLEYAITVMFTWMFIEGLYLNSKITGHALSGHFNHVTYCAAGWGLPLIFTTLWTIVTAVHYKKEKLNTCWYGYNFSKLYWIVQGPRLAVIMVNLLFLLNILRVLIMKLHRGRSTEIEKLRKAVKAALVLLPLLGITNVLNMTEAPLGGSVWEFGLWSFGIHLLRSLQGFFIAFLYCFMNGEVQKAMRKHYRNYMLMRRDPRFTKCSFKARRRRNGAPRPSTPYRIKLESGTWIPMRTVNWMDKRIPTPPPPPRLKMAPLALAETEFGQQPIRAILTKETSPAERNSGQLRSQAGAEHEYDETSFSKDVSVFDIETSSRRMRE